MFAPENPQIAVLKLEASKLVERVFEESDSDCDIEKFDQVKSLRFSHLKKIDRVSMTSSANSWIRRGRHSRVSISGDSTFFYDSTSDDNVPLRKSNTFTPLNNSKRFIEIEK
jgi:hypothetical protein